MLRNYIENQQKSLQNKQVDFYTKNGLHVYFKNPLENDQIDVEAVINRVEDQIPAFLLTDVEMVIIGWFKEFDERGINAFYQDGILHVSNMQDDEDDMVDDIIHEIAHSVETIYGYEIYGDSQVKQEFLDKRKFLHDELWALGYKAPLTFFLETEYNKEFDEFLLETVGYDKLSIICNGVFINAYAPTSLREYFATGFTDFYMYPAGRRALQDVSPRLYNKIILLQDEEKVDNYR